VQIILNCSILRAQRTGIGNYVAELTAALQRHHQLRIATFDGRQLGPLPASATGSSRVTARSWLRNLPGAYRFKRFTEQRCFDRAVAQSQPDLYHDPSLWPLRFAGPTIMTVHDLTHVAFAHTQPAARVREIERRLPSALNNAARILVDSEFIARELQQRYGVPARKLAVAPLAHSEQFAPRRDAQIAGTLLRFGVTVRHYFLFVGTLEPRKNLSLALQAHAALPQPLRERFPLVIVGGSGWLTRDLETAIERAVASGCVRRLGYLDNDDLADVLAGARAFVFPSLYEGFGLPPLEAMASGTPVLSSNAASLPEVGGDAVRYFDPHDAAELTRLLAELIDDDGECRRLAAAGLARAQQFSWEKCAAITAAAYRGALADG